MADNKLDTLFGCGFVGLYHSTEAIYEDHTIRFMSSGWYINKNGDTYLIIDEGPDENSEQRLQCYGWPKSVNNYFQLIDRLREIVELPMYKEDA